jgi:hypothetical protein
MSFETLHWPALAVCVVVGQAFLTLWFVALFGEPWAKAYGAADKAQHAKEIPGYTYGIGLLCTALLTLGLALLQGALGVHGASSGLLFGLGVALTLSVTTMLPGYAFLKRWRAFGLAAGSQISLILILSVILAVWH